ncbi:MAG: peroxiredoxin [Chloroflexota bacterium]|nr:MAG: peroxiredoxin [Chloroflexota bacterium]
MTATPNERMAELSQRFTALEPELKDSPEKEALSILHGMIQENRREMLAGYDQNSQTLDQSFEKIANLYKSAPGMEGPAENEGLTVGIEAPDFTLPDADAKETSLSDFRGKNVVLVFYPLDWSPACSDQLSLYQSELAEFEKLDAVVIGISVDSLYSHGAWSAVRGITFPLLADFHPNGEVSMLYKVMRHTEGFSERALYIIDKQGTIRYSHVSPLIHHIPDIYELFEQLEEINQ